MIPIELTHYSAWAQRLKAALDAAYPRTLWLVQDPADIIRLPVEHDRLDRFYLVAMTEDGSRQITANVPFTLVVVVDEEAFALMVFALGRELERRLKAMVGEGGSGGI